MNYPCPEFKPVRFSVTMRIIRDFLLGFVVIYSQVLQSLKEHLAHLLIFECIDRIVTILEEIGTDAGSRHDF